MEEKAQRLLKEQPALTSIYNNLPANSAIVLLQHYGPVSADLTREVRQFYVPVQFGPIRLSTNALYNCVSALMEFTNWELEPKKETHVKEFTAQYAYRIANDIFIEADRVYSLSVERNKQVLSSCDEFSIDLIAKVSI